MLIIRYRSAITGRYVSKAYADQHPETTVREQIWTSRRKDQR